MKITDILKNWQKEVFETIKNNKRIIGMVSRQSGKSFLCAFTAVYYSIIENQPYIIVSCSQRQADELLKKCLLLTRFFQKMLMGTSLYFDFSNNATEIRFSHGGRILSLPNSPETIRGYSGNVILDECAFLMSDYEIYQAIVPFLTSNPLYKIIIISTPNGKSGLFYDIFVKNKDFVKFSKTIYEVGLSEKEIEELKKNCLDSEIFAQEYLLQWQDSNTSLFSFDLIRSCINHNNLNSKNYYFGIDIGRSHDLTSIAILCKSDKKYILKDIVTLKNLEFSSQEKAITDLIKKYNPIKVYIDETGIGKMIAENLHKKFKSVIPFNFNNKNKIEMYNNLKKMMSEGDFVIDLDKELEEMTINDLHKIKRVVLNNGISYKADSDNSGHADIATSIGLGVYDNAKSTLLFTPKSF